MNRAPHRLRLLVALVFALLLSTGVPSAAIPKPQEDLAATLRQQAAEYRAEAARFQQRAKDWQVQADARRKMAADARASAASWRKKGDIAQAAKMERAAKNDEFEATQRQNQADSAKAHASQLEKQAKEKEDEAAKASKDPILVVLANADATLKMARDEFQSMKSRIRDKYVDHEFAKSNGAFYSTEATYVTYTEEMLDERIKSTEDRFAQSEKDLADNRAKLLAKSEDEATAAANAYRRVYYTIIDLIVGAMDLSIVGWDFHVVPIYRQERVLHIEYEGTQKRLRDSDAPYAVVKATMEALEKRQGEQRKLTFDDVAAKFRSDKNYLAFIRHEWINEVNRWHDLAVKLSSGNDVHRGQAQGFTELLEKNFGNTVNLQGFGTFSGRYVNVPYDQYDWCKSFPYPDIQTYKDSPATFGWNDILNEKMPLQSLGGKFDGAAKDRKP